MLLLALLPSVTALAEKPASHAQRPRHLVEEAGLFDLKYDFILGNGHSTFNLNNSVDLNTDSGPVTPVVADFNGDGKLDLATVTGDNHGGAVAILLQQ
jgi:hypothetical protein